MTPIKEKVAKILALAADPSATEGETRAARKKAADLMEKHGLTDEDVSGREDVVSQEYYHPSYKTCPSWHGKIAVGAAKYNGCFVFKRSKAYHPTESRRALQYTFYGRPSRIEQAIYFMESAEAQVQSLTAQWRDETGASRRETNGYRNGLAAVVVEKFKALLWPEKDEGEEEEALVHIGNALKTQHSRAKALAHKENNLGAGSASRYNRSGAEAGRSDGKKLSVRKGVSSVPKSRQLSN